MAGMVRQRRVFRVPFESTEGMLPLPYAAAVVLALLFAGGGGAIMLKLHERVDRSAAANVRVSAGLTQK
jgi:hypothetical protein